MREKEPNPNNHIKESASKYCKLTATTVPSIDEGQLTTKLTGRKFEKRMHDVVECFTLQLLNGVGHIWSGQIIAQSGVSEVVIADKNNDEEAVSACPVIAREQVMTSVAVAADHVDDGDKDDDDSTKLHKYCTSNPWVDGITRMRGMNHLQVKAVGDVHRKTETICQPIYYHQSLRNERAVEYNYWFGDETYSRFSMDKFSA